MKKEFWEEKWTKNQIGFHLNYVHPQLKKFENKLSLMEGDLIFVPLCGKSLDMIWLTEQGFNVIGVELSQLAIEQFINENNLEFNKITFNGLTRYDIGQIQIYHANLFDLTSIHLTDVKAIYDRAALIALPTQQAIKYVDFLYSITSLNLTWLLIVLEFDKSSGPPFSQNKSTISGLFNRFSKVDVLHENNIIDKEPKFKSDGCQYLFERVYLIKK